MGIKKREIRACCSPAIKGSSIAHTVRRTTLEAHADMNIYITTKHLYKRQDLHPKGHSLYLYKNSRVDIITPWTSTVATSFDSV